MRETVHGTEEDGHDLSGFIGKRVHEIIDAQEAHDLIADEKIEDENEYQGRCVSDEADIGGRYLAFEKAWTDAEKANNSAEYGRQDAGPEAQSDGGNQSLCQESRFPCLFCFAKAQQVVRNGLPFPMVVQSGARLEYHVGDHPRQSRNDRDVQRGDAQAVFVCFCFQRIVPTTGSGFPIHC